MLLVGYPDFVTGSGTLASATFSGCNVFTYALLGDAMGVSAKQARRIIDAITGPGALSETRSLGHFTIVEKKYGHAPDRLIVTHTSSVAAFGERWRGVQRQFRQERMRVVGQRPKTAFSVNSGSTF